MRHLGPVVLVLARRMGNCGKQFSMGDDITPQLVGDEADGSRPLAFHEFPEEPLGCLPISSLLEQNIDRIPILVDRPPEVEPLSPDGDKKLVEMPDVPQADLLSF